MSLTPQQRAARNYRRWNRRGFIPLQPPVRAKPDLPIPTLTAHEQHINKLFCAGLITVDECQQRAPGLHAKLIIIGVLTGARGRYSRQQYETFDRLPRGLRDVINEGGEVLKAFKKIYHHPDLKYIISQLRSVNRRSQFTLNDL